MSEQSTKSWGIAIIIAVVGIVAWVLTWATPIPNETRPPLPELPTTLTGFLANSWYLPAEPLLGFVEIPTGEFIMGSDPTLDNMAYDNEIWSQRVRRGRVNLQAFYISRFEVTQAQFLKFLHESEHVVPEFSGEGLNHPVTEVTWTDAMAYCRWLEQQLREAEQTPQLLKQLLGEGWRITLPNEAQWEKAARGANGQRYPWGNNPEDATRFANIRANATAPVGSLPCPNCSYDLADISGNVWEMTRSYYLPYPFDSNARLDMKEDALFVMRGGGFSDDERNSRATIRGGIDPGARSPSVGFRVVLSQD